MHLHNRLGYTLCVASVALFAVPAWAPPAEQETDSVNTIRDAVASGGRFRVVRLRPGDDLRRELETITRRHQIRAGAIVTAVGSLERATVRLADDKEGTEFPGKLEIVSLTGTLGPDGVHLHLSASDREGRTVGGHLLEGCPIYTTAEIVMVELQDLTFARELDPQTGYHELVVKGGARPPAPGR